LNLKMLGKLPLENRITQFVDALSEASII